ncbi:MAG TPA: FAD-binding protein, partial [Spirochaetales bacterium]|nr:FAD-binding protein [Spirochaetales bacterium]
MKDLVFDSVVIGGGAAGMAAALELDRAGFSCAIVEREEALGGILTQCIHNGFGLIEFNEELSGPEFAERIEERLAGTRITSFTGATVMELDASGDIKTLYCYTGAHGVMRLS